MLRHPEGTGSQARDAPNSFTPPRMPNAPGIVRVKIKTCQIVCHRPRVARPFLRANLLRGRSSRTGPAAIGAVAGPLYCPRHGRGQILRPRELLLLLLLLQFLLLELSLPCRPG